MWSRRSASPQPFALAPLGGERAWVRGLDLSLTCGQHIAPWFDDAVHSEGVPGWGGLAAQDNTNWWSPPLQLNLVTLPPLRRVMKSAAVRVMEWLCPPPVVVMHLSTPAVMSAIATTRE